MAIEFKDGKYVDPKTGRVTLDPTVYKDWQIAEEAEKNLPPVDYFREKLGLELVAFFLQGDDLSLNVGVLLLADGERADHVAERRAERGDQRGRAAAAGGRLCLLYTSPPDSIFLNFDVRYSHSIGEPRSFKCALAFIGNFPAQSKTRFPMADNRANGHTQAG